VVQNGTARWSPRKCGILYVDGLSDSILQLHVFCRSLCHLHMLQYCTFENACRLLLTVVCVHRCGVMALNMLLPCDSSINICKFQYIRPLALHYVMRHKAAYRKTRFSSNVSNRRTLGSVMCCTGVSRPVLRFVKAEVSRQTVRQYIEKSL
jgi:hypothetical protein